MKFAIYDTADGRIKRIVNGPPSAVENQRLDDGEDVITQPEVQGALKPKASLDLSTDPPTVVDEAPPDSNADLKQRYRDATTTDEKLDVLFELVTGEHP